MSLRSGSAKVGSEGRCRTCPATDDLTKHHLIPESWFRNHPYVDGRHNRANFVPVCRYCHGLIDGKRSVLRAEKRRALRATLTGEELKFVAKKRGAPWLDHHYPTETINHALVS